MSVTVVWSKQSLTFSNGQPQTADPVLQLLARVAMLAAKPVGLRHGDPDLFAAQALLRVVNGEIVAHSAPAMPEDLAEDARDGPSLPPLTMKSYPGPDHVGNPGHWGGSRPRRMGGGARPQMYGGGGATYAADTQPFEVDDRLILATPGLTEMEVSYRGGGLRGAGGVRQAAVYDPKSGGQFVVPEANLRRIVPVKPAVAGAELTAKLQAAIADTYFQIWWEDGANDDAELRRMGNEARAACDLPPLSEAEFAARRQARHVDNPKLATAQYEFLKLCAEPGTPANKSLNR